MVIIDPSIPMEYFITRCNRDEKLKSIIVTRDAIDWHHTEKTSINTGILFIKNTPESQIFFNQVWEKRNTPFGYDETYGTCKNQGCLGEQAAMADLLEEMQTEDFVAIIPQRSWDGIGINTFFRENYYLAENKQKTWNYCYDYPSGRTRLGDFAAQPAGVPIRGYAAYDTKPHDQRREAIEKLLIFSRITKEQHQKARCRELPKEEENKILNEAQEAVIRYRAKMQ